MERARAADEPCTATPPPLPSTGDMSRGDEERRGGGSGGGSTVDEAPVSGSRFNISRKSLMKTSHGRVGTACAPPKRLPSGRKQAGVSLGEGQRGVEMEMGVVASTHPASMVDANETSVVDARDEVEVAGDGSRGGTMNGWRSWRR